MLSAPATKTFASCAAALLLAAIAVLASLGPAEAETPDETFKSLGLTRSATPKELYDALTKRYYDPAQGAGKGSLSQYWQPIPITKYLDPRDFYAPPQGIEMDARREQCVECHEQTTPGWAHSWRASVHGNLEEIRNLSDKDSRAYKKGLIADVEANLRSMGLLKAGEPLKEVGCIDCHMGVGKEHGQHKTELKMPDAAACGQCHLQQFAERESERDTAVWPQGQRGVGRCFNQHHHAVALFHVQDSGPRHIKPQVPIGRQDLSWKLLVSLGDQHTTGAVAKG